MNKARRGQLRTLSAKLSCIVSIDDKAALDECISMLEDIKWDEEDYFDNMPENLQGSMRGCESEEAIDNMDQALDALNEAIEAEDEEEFSDAVNSAIEYIDDCI
jgi:hypothetical protein